MIILKWNGIWMIPPENIFKMLAKSHKLWIVLFWQSLLNNFIQQESEIKCLVLMKMNYYIQMSVFFLIVGDFEWKWEQIHSRRSQSLH